MHLLSTKQSVNCSFNHLQSEAEAYYATNCRASEWLKKVYFIYISVSLSVKGRQVASKLVICPYPVIGTFCVHGLGLGEW